MADTKSKLRAILFNHGTTYRNDYRDGKIREPILTTYKPKPTVEKAKLPPLKDTHTLTAYKKGTVPFNVFHRPKDIIGTIPSQQPKPYVRPKDTDLEEVRKTRPRVVLTPAISMDDVEDPNARAVLCSTIYMTAVRQLQQDSKTPFHSVKAPLPYLPAKAMPIALPNLQVPYVSPEWKMESVSWDRNQLRGHCTPTEDFWYSRKISRCLPCEQTATVAAYRNMIRR